MSKNNITVTITTTFETFGSSEGAKKLSEVHGKYENSIKIYHETSIKDVPPLDFNKTPLVQSLVERTAFSDQN